MIVTCDQMVVKVAYEIANLSYFVYFQFQYLNVFKLVTQTLHTFRIPSERKEKEL